MVEEMGELLKKIIKQKPSKLIILIYNVLRFVILKLIYPQRIKSGLIQNLHPSTEIAIGRGVIELGSSIFTRRNVSIRVESGKLKIGTSFFNQGCTITVMKNVVIGNDCLFGPNVVIVDHDHNYSHLNNLRGNHYLLDDVIIGNNVWVGSNVTILRGTVIGDGAVIGAGATVKGNIEKNTVVYPKQNQIRKTIINDF
ncbi:acyltransferase [Metabacillus indicus]|uniref:acyltransferase n=1 Tax=Metabacillus indicus TaxID=246786 RepID=UPI0039843DF5